MQAPLLSLGIASGVGTAVLASCSLGTRNEGSTHAAPPLRSASPVVLGLVVEWGVGPGLGVDYAAVAALALSALVALALYRNRRSESSSAVRDSLVRAVDDAVVVVTDGTVADYNDAAAQALPGRLRVGAAVDDALPPAVTADERVRTGTAGHTTVSVGSGDSERYEMAVSPSADGVVLVFRAAGRSERERALEQLHEATRDLMDATTVEAVATVGSETAMDVLDLSMNGVHLYEAAADELAPAAWSDEADVILDGTPPSLPVDGSLAGRAYRAGETMRYGDVRETDAVLDPETAVRSELYVPLGDHGVLVASSTTPRDFDDGDEALARVLGANAEAALDRVERERELQQRNERLDEFASLVAHDLQNPLQVAQTRLALAREERDGDHLASAAGAADRIETLIEDLLTLARSGRLAEETEPVDLAALVEDCWTTVETGAASLVVEGAPTARADRSHLRRLVENLLANAVEHGSTGSRAQSDDAVEHGSRDSGPAATGAADGEDDTTVAVGGLADGFYVADDGPGIPPGERERVFEVGVSTGESGTGLGLNIVADIARGHGWEVRLTESERGGARFEITGVETVEGSGSDRA